MYSRRKGKSGSKKPVKSTKKTWIRYSGKEIEQLIIKLVKAGNQPSKIGMILRDVYGVPDVKTVLKKKLGKILKDNKLLPELPEDFLVLAEREIKLMKHLEKNKKDMTAKRGLQLTESRIRRLTKYYKRVGKLPSDFKYDREKIRLITG